jgi:hypothetical protein
MNIVIYRMGVKKDRISPRRIFNLMYKPSPGTFNIFCRNKPDFDNSRINFYSYYDHEDGQLIVSYNINGNIMICDNIYECELTNYVKNILGINGKSI